MTRIENYSIASAEDHYTLVKLVDEQCKNGWQPNGSVFSYTFGEQLLICQPMVQYRTAKRKPALKTKSRREK